MITPVVVVVNKIKAVYSCLCPSCGEQRPGAVVSGFFIVPSTSASNGAITQPLQMLVRQMQIKTVSRACISWVSIPRGREKPSYIGCCASDVVNRDKRENLSPVDKTVDNLPTRAFVGCFVYA